jgi:hypothetical protein
VRRALLRQWPALTRFYRLMPWDSERLTIDELNEYIRQYAEYQREMRKR